MTQLALKYLLSAAIVVAVSELAKRSATVGGLVASLPLVSLLAFFWLYRETGSVERVASLSTSIFWFVLPSLVLFLALPALLRRGFSFSSALALSSAATVAAYAGMGAALSRSGIKL